MASILIVEDDPDVRTLLGLCFLAEGHSVTATQNGLEALLYLNHRPADLVVTDLAMPEMDGLALLRHLRANGYSHLPVIVLTGHPAERTAALAAGADAFFTKPVPVADLLKTAMELMAGRRRKVHS